MKSLTATGCIRKPLLHGFREAVKAAGRNVVVATQMVGIALRASLQAAPGADVRRLSHVVFGVSSAVTAERFAARERELGRKTWPSPLSRPA